MKQKNESNRTSCHLNAVYKSRKPDNADRCLSTADAKMKSMHYPKPDTTEIPSMHDPSVSSVSATPLEIPESFAPTRKQSSTFSEIATQDSIEQPPISTLSPAQTTKTDDLCKLKCHCGHSTPVEFNPDECFPPMISEMEEAPSFLTPEEIFAYNRSALPSYYSCSPQFAGATEDSWRPGRPIPSKPNLKTLRELLEKTSKWRTEKEKEASEHKARSRRLPNFRRKIRSTFDVVRRSSVVTRLSASQAREEEEDRHLKVLRSGSHPHRNEAGEIVLICPACINVVQSSAKVQCAECRETFHQKCSGQGPQSVALSPWRCPKCIIE